MKLLDQENLYKVEIEFKGEEITLLFSPSYGVDLNALEGDYYSKLPKDKQEIILNFLMEEVF